MTRPTRVAHRFPATAVLLFLLVVPPDDRRGLACWHRRDA